MASSNAPSIQCGFMVGIHIGEGDGCGSHNGCSLLRTWVYKRGDTSERQRDSLC